MPLAAISPDLCRPPLSAEITEKLRSIARGFCDEEGGCHGPDHGLRVEKTCLFIGTEMGARLDILQAAAILHDIGRGFETSSQGKICHAEKGAQLARHILAACGFARHDIQAIRHAIRCHRFRGTNIPESLEARILFDADKLDSIGAVGIGRAFLFAGQIGAKLHNDSGDISATTSYSTNDTAYREFKVKMCRVKERMLTPIGRQLACERHDFMEVFFQRLDKEIFGGQGSSHPAG
ncbi:MAG: phosphohydrolase [Desulfobulbaceae bacterium]|nr:MAG: phosphohydrolase [Desulfobulbaceae bacterium]